MIGHLAAGAQDHAFAALAATVNLAVAAWAFAASVVGAKVNDGVLVTAVLFVLGAGTGIAGWALVLLVRLSNVVSRLEATAEDHERRLQSGGI